MAGNEWINGYLEAILDAGSKRTPFTPSPLEAAAAVPTGFSPTKYFVEEVVNRFDDADLHKTWIKVVATRNTQERNNRLENMCWRIWHLARKKKQIQWEDARRLAKMRLEREQGSKDPSEDLSELSEGEKEREKDRDEEKEKEKGSTDSPKNYSISRINSDLKMWPNDNDAAKLLIRDSDTGWQVKYVVELTLALAATKGVYRVDLLTRQISSPDVDWTYGEPVEMLTLPTVAEDPTATSDCCGAYIIRLPCGPRDRYLELGT